jgi:DNA-directed RNA polymerase subunit RPC12/RpoP
MEIRFTCTQCGRKLKADPEAAGQRADCPQCGNQFVIPAASDSDTSSEFSPEKPAWDDLASSLLDTTKGKYSCPICWQRFDLGDIMHISVHENLKGDPILGQDAQQRFYAMRFNDQRQALDAMGIVCTDIACPHCRRRLPVGFIEEPHHIISLVGDHSAGKSYYLAVMSKTLPAALFKHFQTVMQDADPTGNAALNELRKNLFAASTPEQIKVEKTKMEGGMYERLPRQGRTVALPRPFIYTLGSSDNVKPRSSLIFYDNAGEHFQPGIRLVEQPGALHVASASAILFLLDPFNDPDFRRAMHGTKDPQMEDELVDQQDIILSEMRSRILNIRGLPSNHRFDEPFAVVVGKFDAWRHLLPADAIEDPLRNGILETDVIRRNSRRLRELLLGICPAIVANAEALSSEVCYFAVSAFGHTPVRVGKAIAPDPARLNPFQVEIPPLWALAQLCPHLVPSQA